MWTSLVGDPAPTATLSLAGRLLVSIDDIWRHLVSSKQALAHAPSRGLVARTDALWNKLACPREPTGSLSEAIYSPHTQRLAAGPASRASGWPPNRGPKSLAQPERPAANPAGACDARRLRGGLLGARNGASARTPPCRARPRLAWGAASSAIGQYWSLPIASSPELPCGTCGTAWQTAGRDCTRGGKL